MATRTETIYHHSCDLCGEEKDEAELASVFSEHQPWPGALGRERLEEGGHLHRVPVPAGGRAAGVLRGREGR